MGTEPLTLRTVAQVIRNAGVVDGCRQGLEQTAKNLREQAEHWRREAQVHLDAADTKKQKKRAKAYIEEAERGAARLEAFATQIDAQVQHYAGQVEQGKSQVSAVLSELEAQQKAAERKPSRLRRALAVLLDGA